MGISVWPLESDSNVIHADLFYSFLDQMYGVAGVLENDDLTVVEDTQGIGVKITPGGAVVQYDSAPGGKRIFYNSAESKSGPGTFYNPDFDTDPATTGWIGFGGATIARSTAVFQSAPASCQVVTNGASTYTRGIQLSGVNTKADPNRDTELTCWATIPAPIGIKLVVTEHDAALAQIAVHEDVKVGTGDWLKFSCKFKTLANTRYIWCQVLVSHTSSTTFYVDTFDTTGNFEWARRFRSPHPGLPRVDRVVVKIRDENVAGGGDTNTDGKFSVIPGFPTSGATLSNLSGAAAVPTNSFLLANVLVPAGATALSAANIDNAVRTPAELNVEIPAPPEPVEIPPPVPLGVPFPYMGTAAPTGYLMCIGQTISRTTYAALFAVVGTSYNTGGEAGTDFRLPDMRGRVPVGVGTNADVNALGKNEGAVIGDRRPKHKHTGNVNSDGSHSHGGSSNYIGNHSHATTDTQGFGFNLTTGTAGESRSYLEPRGTGMSGAGEHQHTITTDSQGSHQHSYTAGPSANSPTDAPAYLAFNWIVRDGL